MKNPNSDFKKTLEQLAIGEDDFFLLLDLYTKENPIIRIHVLPEEAAQARKFRDLRKILNRHRAERGKPFIALGER